MGARCAVRPPTPCAVPARRGRGAQYWWGRHPQPLRLGRARRQRLPRSKSWAAGARGTAVLVGAVGTTPTTPHTHNHSYAARPPCNPNGAVAARGCVISCRGQGAGGRGQGAGGGGWAPRSAHQPTDRTRDPLLPAGAVAATAPALPGSALQNADTTSAPGLPGVPAVLRAPEGSALSHAPQPNPQQWLVTAGAASRGRTLCREATDPPHPQTTKLYAS